ncbi:hypothetical protein YYG_00799 [Plasmodium vinckei petteri]|uniref:MI domain-containing protein n=1 Tax=Plasmodium vinckei petteri TaxID=138298 RepID=W7B6V9_PLAVN|nr:hypothetical protein YYG_00799 [Plasmodium vinckei petteri]CAD2107292.1 conserved Plasmodium protein, unknown function [Plasmodium vinckei petteri]
MKGTILSRKEKRKLKRAQKKRNKLLFSNKKNKFKRNDNTNVSNNEKENPMRNPKNDLVGKFSIKGNKKKRNSNSNDLSDTFHKKKAKKMNRSIRDLDEDQKKDEYLLSYLSKKLKINNNKHNEEKLFNELTKDGFDSSLLKLTDIIFDEFQKKRPNKKGNKKLKNREEDEEVDEEEDEEVEVDDEEEEVDDEEEEEEDDEEEEDEDEEEDEEEEVDDDEEEVDEEEDEEVEVDDEEVEVDDEEEEEEDDEEEEEEDDEEEEEEDDEEEVDDDEEEVDDDEEEADDDEEEIEEDEDEMEDDEEEIEEDEDEMEDDEEEKMQAKGIAKKENNTRKRKENYKDDEKKIEKFLMSSLNKTSEFNIKCIIEDICKYFHNIKNPNLKITFVNSIVKIISSNFTNANITDTHIYLFVVMVCILNNLTYRKLLKDFLKELVIIFKRYFKNNINLMKRVERENEITNINLINNEESDKNNTMIKISTNTEQEETKDACDNSNNNEAPNKFDKQALEDKPISQSEYDKYQDFKIILRNLLKCFSLFYALNYVDFDFITDIINILCEYISINSVDNIIIILKICGMKLKNDDISHLNYITDHLKKEVDNYILKNNIYLEKSKLRFLIKDIEDLKNGKMKFYFLNKFEFLSNILNEFEKKYEFKKDILSFSFQNMFKNDDKTKKKTNKLNKAIEGENENDDTNSNDEKKNMKESNFNKLNYLVGGEEAHSNEPHYNKMLKKYKIQGILSKKIFLIVKNSLDIEECVHNLSVILKNEKNIPHVIQTIIQIILYDKKYKVAYCRILSNISKIKNRVFLFSLKTVVINFIKNINNYDLKKILFLSKLFIFLLKENLIDFKIFKFIDIDKNEDQAEQKNNSATFNLHFFFKTIFILISIDEKSTDPSKNAQLWENISQVLHNAQISSSYFYSFKKIIKKYIFDEEKNIKCVYPHFNMKYIQCFHKFLEKKTKKNL